MPITIYKSSAGSGKTYTLVLEYLKILLQDPKEFRNILAITFTNKATKEMKIRIIEALAALAQQKDADLAANLEQYFMDGKDANDEKLVAKVREEIRLNAKRALNNILHGYSDFSVSTIDSFFQKIMRFFIQEIKSKEIKIPMRYEVEMNMGHVLDQITSKLMLEIGQKELKALTHWMESFTFSMMEQDKGWNIESSIKDLGMEIFKETYYDLNQGQDELLLDNLQDLTKKIWAIRKDFEQQVDKHGKEAQELIKDFGLTEKDFARGTIAYFNRIQNRDYSINATLGKVLGGNREAWVTKSGANREKALQLVDNGLQAIFDETVEYQKDRLPHYHAATEVLKNIYTYGILARLRAKLRDYRTENNLVLISDTNNILHEIVSEQSMPFIFEKVGTVFRHILIDEFQDTSNFQWRNLLPLVINSLSEEHAVLVVGDVKQSIYRWRGGNMNLLLNGVKRDLGGFRSLLKEDNLDTNWRSRERIVQFNNAFFQAGARELATHFEDYSEDLIGAAYSNILQKVKKKGGGYVNIRFLSGDKESGILWQEEALDEMYQLIQNLQTEGYQLSDIAILTRTNVQGSEIAVFLAEKGVKVVSSESLLLKNSLKVKLLIYVLKYLSDQRDTIARTAVLVHYFTLHPELQEQFLPAANNDRHLIYSDHLLKDDPDCLFYRVLPEGFIREMDNLRKKPLYEMVEMLVLLLGIHEEPDAYVQRFQDLILEHSITKSNDIRHFIAWWDENQERDKTSIIVPEGENAVKIMTIHKAKGLEFPIVLMPYGDWSFEPKANSILWAITDADPFKELGPVPLRLNKSLGESLFAGVYQQEVLQSYIDNLNTLYVAFTRPTEQLYVFTKKVTKRDNFKAAHKLIHGILSADHFEFNPYLDDETNNFEVGSRGVLSQHKREKETSSNLKNYLCIDYQDRIIIRSDAHKHMELYDTSRSKAIRIGKQVHAILEKLHHPEQLNSIIRKLKMGGIVFESEEEEVRKRIYNIFALPEVEEWFSHDWDDVLCERPMMKDGERRIPDRVMLKGKEATIVDYKTGKASAKYDRQLQVYAFYLKQMGYTIKAAYLLFVGEESWVSKL